MSRLEVSAEGEREIRMSRTFDAPRAMVWKAYTTPELVKLWLGIRGGWTLAECEIDLRVGGRYRYVWRHPERAGEMGVSGEYLEVDAPARFVCTERFDQPWYPGGGAITTITFDERAGTTTLTMTIRYESREARDQVLASPATEGVAEGYERLAGVLASGV